MCVTNNNGITSHLLARFMDLPSHQPRL